MVKLLKTIVILSKKLKIKQIKSKFIVTLFLLLCCPFNIFSQTLFYSDILQGGVTGNGATRGAGSGAITMNVKIPPISTIKKAFLIAAREKDKEKITVTLNNKNYRFSDSTIITNGFLSLFQNPVNFTNSSMHAIDITTDIDSSINIYNLFIPPPSGTSGVDGLFAFYYLYIVFENPIYPKINCYLFLNNQDVAPITTYSLNNINPFNNSKPIGLGVATSNFCGSSYPNDSSYISVNNNTIGLLGGEDQNSSMVTCASAWANFAHYNDTLFGLDDDTSDSLMGGTDALADIKSYVNNGDTSVDVTFTYQTLNNSNGGILTNPIRAVMLSYSTPCDTFSTAATATQDTICLGDSVQLNATGGATYSWYSPFSTFNDSTLANPIATPSQTTTYIVTIKNDSGCVKTEHVKIWVRLVPTPDTIVISPQTCGSPNGSITVGTIAQGTPPFTIVLTNLTTSTIEPQTTNLLSGNYQLTITDNNGCTWQSDTLFVPQINNVIANFYSFPQAPWNNPNQSLGKAPMEVSFFNASQNANMFEWSISEIASYLAMTGPKDTIVEIPICTGMTSSCGLQHFFTEGGTYEV
ncbi:MAG: hypothetical protein RQ875_14595, partial [Vicingaceae bacterium]|nr:hypothetical protein [Vicingaceae bacterium]